MIYERIASGEKNQTNTIDEHSLWVPSSTASGYSDVIKSTKIGLLQNVFIAFRVSEKLNLIRKYLAWPPKVSNFFCSSKEHKIHCTTMPCVMLYNFSLLFIRNTMMYHSDI